MYRKAIDHQGVLVPGIVRIADGAFVPADPANADWQAYQVWLEAGHTPPTEPSFAPADGERGRDGSVGRQTPSPVRQTEL